MKRQVLAFLGMLCGGFWSAFGGYNAALLVNRKAIADARVFEKLPNYGTCACVIDDACVDAETVKSTLKLAVVRIADAERDLRANLELLKAASSQLEKKKR